MMFAFLLATQIFLAQPVLAVEDLQSHIPIQVSVSHEKYPVFFQKALRSVRNGQDECAKLVNRLFLARFGRAIFGDAWTLQLAPANQEFLDLVWRLEEDQFSRFNLYLNEKKDRVKHFRQVYFLLDQEKYPIGVLGFMYRFSEWREYIASNLKWMPQTHVAFLAGRKSFEIKNETGFRRTIEEILGEKFGKILDSERAFVNSRVPLSLELLPEGSYFYNDYLLEEQFKQSISGSLLELFLRKDLNKQVAALLRPVSFSRISEKLIKEMENQKELLADFEVEFIPGKEFGSRDFEEKELWTEFLAEKLNIKNPRKSLLIPVPKTIKVAKAN